MKQPELQNQNNERVGHVGMQYDRKVGGGRLVSEIGSKQWPVTVGGRGWCRCVAPEKMTETINLLIVYQFYNI